jgi:hypothetical protein
MTLTEAFLMGSVLTATICALVALWVLVSKTQGNERPLTIEEIRERVGETWEEAA